MCRELLVRNTKFVSVAPLRGGGGARALLGGGGRERAQASLGGGVDPGFISGIESVMRGCGLWEGMQLCARLIVCQVKY